MSDYKERLNDELNELSLKVVNLINYLYGSEAEALDRCDFGLLMCQLRAMRQYQDILSDRKERMKG